MTLLLYLDMQLVPASQIFDLSTLYLTEGRGESCTRKFL